MARHGGDGHGQDGHGLAGVERNGETSSGKATTGMAGIKEPNQEDEVKPSPDTLVKQELKALTDQGKGILRPEAVVQFAADPETALHSRFEWDNGKAGHEYRLWQARQLIRVVVIYEPQIEQNVEVYVSLPSDRENEGGGYRRMVDVMSDTDRRKQLLDAALAELAAFQRKYASLKELATVFAAARRAKEKAKSSRKRATATA